MGKKPDVAIIIKETRNIQTLKGTKYQVEKWSCQLCGQDKSTLYIDEEWCHGDTKAANFCRGKYLQGCGPCIMDIPTCYETERENTKDPT